MLKILKRTLVVTLALSVLSVSALANTWKVVDYDTSDWSLATGEIPIVYQELDVNGLPTGNYVSGSQIDALGLDLKVYATNVEWREAFFDRNYDVNYGGNRIYARLFVDGKATERVAPTGGLADLQYQWVDYMWELEAPYKIHQKLYAYINGAWVTDPDGIPTYPTRYSGENADIVVSQPQVGVDMSGFASGDATGREYMFVDAISKVFEKRLTGPAFPSTLTSNSLTKVISTFVDGTTPATVTWVSAGYEVDAPYRVYEFLSADGYVMDGTNGYPRIFRYTGGYAKPSITYIDHKIDLAEFKAGPNTAPVIARVVHDGVATSVYAKTGEYATLNIFPALNYDEAYKYADAELVARVNANGKVSVIKEPIKVRLPLSYLGGSLDIEWGSVTVEVIPSMLNNFISPATIVVNPIY